MEDTNKVYNLLKKYSFDDLAKAFFVLNLWLPNIASQIKIQYLYVILESIYKDLPSENKTKHYSDFEQFCEKLIEILPSFPMLEDYVPEADWGEIKYYINKKFYNIFYGGDLCNPYDFYYSFEIIHESFEEQYKNIMGRSPIEELEYCLKQQDSIIKGIDQKMSGKGKVSPGDISIPDENFWRNSLDFLDKFNPEKLGSQHLLSIYTNNLTESSVIPSIAEFGDKAFKGENSQYFFFKKDGKFYPVMPRRWLAVLYDKWGTILKQNYDDISRKLKGSHPDVIMGIKLGNFIRERVREENIFRLSNVVEKDLHKLNDLIFTAIKAEDKLFLIHVTPPLFSKDDINLYLENIQIELQKAQEILSVYPSRLGLLAEKKIVEFQSKKGKALTPVFIIAVPSPLTSIIASMKIPEGVRMELMTIDQIAGIFDEVEDLSELNQFFDYVENERNLTRMPGLISYLDKFGSFKDSSGILVPGAIEPDLIMLDLSWGSNFRFKSLSEFWNKYPEESLFGHPRSWKIPPRKLEKEGLVLVSKNFFGYAFYQNIGKSCIFINSPVHMMDYRQGSFNDTLMQSLSDSFEIYASFTEKMSFSNSDNKIQIFFCPADVVSKHPELAHLNNLIEEDDLWVMDYSRIGIRDYGIRIIYNRNILEKALRDVKDRTIQIDLFTDVLDRINSLIYEPEIENIKKELEKEKIKKPRFKSFAVRKIASFPDDESVVSPDDRDYKAADKEISKKALKLGIVPGTYSAKEGIEKLNNLRDSIIKDLNEKIKQFDFEKGLQKIISKSNALLHHTWIENEQIKASQKHEVDFDRGKASSENEKKSHEYRLYRYLIEKFVQFQPTGIEELDNKTLSELLALTDRLLHIYASSDFIKYEIFPVNISIDRDYLVSTKDEDNNITEMEKEFFEEQAKLNLGLIGNKKDTVDSSIPVSDYLKKLDKAFRKDFNFGLKDMINVQQVLALWPEKGENDAPFYQATTEEIKKACQKRINGYVAEDTEKILDFLTLKPGELLKIKGDSISASDIPVWEHSKRLMRFDIRPLIKIGDRFYWGPHSIERSSRIWGGISFKHKLPSEIDAPAIAEVLKNGHINLEYNLVKKIEEISLRYTSLVKRNVFPHRYDNGMDNIGDCDVLVYLKDKNILLNIESKIIDSPHSNKDSGRVQRNLFGRITSDGSFEKGDLQKAEDRDVYLKTKGKELIEKLGWIAPSSEPKVISAFVTKIGFWWTKFPPTKTSVKFVEIRLLDNFIKDLDT
jgi:hypothetical protein